MTTFIFQHLNIKKLTITIVSSITLIGLSACQSITSMQNIGMGQTQSQAESSETLQPKLILGNSYRLLIDGRRVPCDTPKPMLCMIAKINDVNNTDLNASQQATQQNRYVKIAYNKIFNFTANPNTRYIIDAKPFIETESQKPTGSWQLVEVLSQQPININLYSN